MGHIQDRWYTTARHPGGRTERVKSEQFGQGLRYRVRYLGPTGQERSKSFPDRAKRDAEAFLVSVESDKLRGSYIDPSAGRITFEEYAEAWLRTRAFDESSRESTGYRVRKHLLPFFGKRRLGEIKPGHIREWDRILADTLASSTRSVVFTHLRSILGAAVDDERIAKNPCSAKSVQPPRALERRVVPWRIEQVLAIRAGLAERYQPILDVGAGCGLRQGEVFGLGVNEIDLDGGWLHVVRQVKKVNSRLVFGLPKNDRDRSIPLPESVAESLRAHIERFKPVRVTLPWEQPTGEPVTVPLIFLSVRNNAINRKHVQREELACGAGGCRHRADASDRHARAAALLRLGASRRRGEHQSVVGVPRSPRSGVHAPGVCAPDAGQ